MNFSYGVPLVRQKKTEKYDFPVLTMQKEPGLKGVRRFLLNKSAMELLGLTHDTQETVSIGFPQQNEGRFVIGRTTDNANVPVKFKYSVHKTENSFSNGHLYEAMKKELDLDVSNDVEFIIHENNSLTVMNENVNAITYKEQEEEENTVVDSNQHTLNLV